MAKTSPISIQATEDTKKRFDDIASTTGISKTELLPKLIDAFETSNLIEAMPGRADEIRNFDTTLDCLKTYYKNSLTIAQTANERAKAAAADELKTHIKTISELQAQLESANKNLEVLTDENALLKEAIEKQQKETAELRASIAEKDEALMRNDAVLTLLKEFKSEWQSNNNVAQAEENSKSE